MDKYAVTNNETRKHIMEVTRLLHHVVMVLLDRAENHDKSKMEDPEVALFDKAIPRLKNTKYGSDEYKTTLHDIHEAVEHHQKNNRHHPEYHENGIDGMNLIDLIEMLSDWKAATERNEDGNIMKSIEINRERFNISPQLTDILKNTVEYLYWN